MRSLVLSVLSLALVGSFAADASACGKRKKAKAAAVSYAAPAYDPCACGGAPVYPNQYPSGYYHGSPYYGAPYGYPGAHSGPAVMPGAVIPGTLPPR